MDGESDLDLGQIETGWSLVLRAHRGPPDEAIAARRQLMVRYGAAIHAYLTSVTGDRNEADDLSQELALRVLRGDFRRADPARGRFRDLLKKAARNLVVDARRRRSARPAPGIAAVPEPGAPDPRLAEIDRQFVECWRDELLERAWGRLARHETRTGQPLHAVLRARAEHPDLSSRQMAERLSDQLGRPVKAGWVRQTLLRARERYVELLLAEVFHSLGNPPADEVDDELRLLGLWEYCRSTRERSCEGHRAP